MKIKKALSIFLAALMLFTMIPMSVFAADTEPDSGHYFSMNAEGNQKFLNIEYGNAITKSELYAKLEKFYNATPTKAYRIYSGFICSNELSSFRVQDIFKLGDKITLIGENDKDGASFEHGTTYNLWHTKNDYRNPLVSLDSFTARYYWDYTTTFEGLDSYSADQLMVDGKNYGEVEKLYGTSHTFTVKEVEGYNATLYVGGMAKEFAENTTSYTHNFAEVTSTTEVKVVYTPKEAPKANIQLTATAGGTVEGIASGEIAPNDNVTFKAVPVDGYYVKSVKINNTEKTTANGYDSDRSCTVSFEAEAKETYEIVVEFAERALVSLGSDKEISYVAGAEFDTIKGSIFSSVVDVAKSVGVATVDDVEITTTVDKADLVEGAKIPVTITAKATDRYPAVTLKETIVITYDRGTAEIVLPEELKMNLASSADATAEKITEYLSANVKATSGAAVSFELGEIVLPVQGGTSKVAVTATAPGTDLYKAASADFEVEFYGEIKDATFTGVTPVIENGVATFTVTPAGDEYIDFIKVNDKAENITTRSHTVTINKLNGAGDALDAAAPVYNIVYETKKFAPAIKEDAVIGFNPNAEVNDSFVAATENAIKSALGLDGLNASIKFYQEGLTIFGYTIAEGYSDFGALKNGVFKYYFGTNVEAKGTDTEKIEVTIPENGKYPAFTKEVTITLEDSRPINIVAKNGSVDYCADKNIDKTRLKNMVLVAVFDKENSIPANLELKASDSNVVVEYKPAGVAVASYGWYNIEENLALNISGITHNFGQKGTETIRIKYTDKDGVVYTSNEVTLTVVDTCYNVTINGIDSKTSIKAAADVTVEKNGLYKEKTEYTVVVTPDTSAKQFVADIIVKDANGTRVNGAVSYNKADLTALEAINAKSSFTTSANGVYTVEVVYGTAAINVKKDTVEFDKYDGVDGKYSAKVPTDKEVFDDLIVSATPDFMAVYGAGHSIKYTVNGKEVALKDVADGTTVNVTISYDNDGVQYQDVSASAKIVLVDPRTATSIETAALTEAVRFLSEDQLKSVLTEALKVKVIADGEELADADYILTVGEVEEADGKSYVDVTITYDGSESYKPAQLVLNNIEVTDVPEKTFVTIVSDGAQVLFNGKAGTSFEVVGNVNYTVKATPAAGYAIESIVVAGDDNTAVTLPLSYNSTAATAQFVAAEHVNYTVTVTSVPAKFDLAEDAKVPFRSGAEAPDVKVIYDAAVNAPARAEGADIKVKYLAREATTLDIEIPSFSIGSVEIPGRTLEIPLSELWLEVGEKIVPVTLDDLKSDPTNVQYLKYYGAREFGSNGDGSTEKIRVTYRDDKWNIAEDETTVTIADSRKITEIASLDSAAVKYGASGEDVVKAFEAVLMSEGAEIEGEIICKTKVAGLDVGSYEAVLAFAGNDDYRPCEKTVALEIEKAPSSVTINSQVAAFGSDINIDPVTDPEGINTIDFVIGVDVENDLEGYVQLRLPGKLGEYFSGEMSLQELSESLNKIANLGDDLLDGLGFSSETVNSLIQALESIAEGLELPNLRIKVNGDLVPSNIGVYIVGAVTADGNYETSADVGYLVITPNATQVELDWIINDENGIITLPAVLSGEYDLRATVVQNDLSDEDFALAKEEVEHVFVGVNLNGEVITSREPVAQAGAYAELAYMLDWGNELFYAEPIVRAYILAPETATVNFVDENNNNGFMFTYDGTAKSVEAEAVSMAGEALPSDNISIYYYGIMNDGTTYNSKEAPVHAGAYTAIATYAETNENGDYVRVGMNVAAIAILPAESEVAVESAVKVYDGEPKTLNVTASPEEIDEFIIITAGISADDQIVTLSGTANVDFPERLDNLFKKYIPEAYENGVKLFEALPVIEKVEQLLDAANIENEEIAVLIENLKALPEGTTLTFKDNAELTDVGAYLVAAIVCEPDYIPSIDAGVLVIVPDVQTTTLSWNEVDENAVFTVEKAKAFDFGATAAAENVEVGTIFAGINANDVIYLSKEASASIGAYTEVAYTKDIDAITYIAKPIIRSYIIVPEAYTVEFVDANENGKFLREYDGTPKAVEAVAYDMSGNLANGGEMTIRYIGVEGDFEMYNSTVAPTNAGTYTVIADFVKRDEDGKLLGMGSKQGVLVITKTLLDFDVIDTTVTYDGKGHFADTSSAVATDYLAAIYSEGNVNIIFPEDMKNIVDLIPVKDYTAANLADEFSQLAAKVENANVKNALNKIAGYIAQYGNAGVVINGKLPTDAGIYEIATVCVAENYITDLSRGTLTILPKDVTITVDNAEKVEGAADPAFTYTVEGLVEGDDLGIIISREEGEEVGEYAITASYTADKNYNVTVADGTLTITEGEKEEKEYLAGSSLLFRDIIKIRYYYDFTEFAGRISSTGLLIWSEEEYNSTDVHDIKTAPYHVRDLAQRSDNGYYYGESDGIPAKNMIDNQVAVAYVVLNDGTVVYTESCVFSPVIYCQSVLAEGTEYAETMKTLAATLMNYGAAAQLHFKYKTDTLMNSWMSAERQVVNYSDELIQALPVFDASKFALTNDTAFVKAGSSLTFAGNIRHNFYFDVQSEAIAGATEMKVLYWNESEYNAYAELTVENAHIAQLAYDADNSASAGINCYRTVLGGVSAKDLRDAFAVVVYYKDAQGNDHYSQIFTDSAHDYVRRVLGNNIAAEMKALAKAFLVYQIAAEDHLLQK